MDYNSSYWGDKLGIPLHIHPQVSGPRRGVWQPNRKGTTHKVSGLMNRTWWNKYSTDRWAKGGLTFILSHSCWLCPETWQEAQILWGSLVSILKPEIEWGEMRVVNDSYPPENSFSNTLKKCWKFFYPWYFIIHTQVRTLVTRMKVNILPRDINNSLWWRQPGPVRWWSGWNMVAIILA